MNFERNPGSRLPADPVYWDRLADLAVAAAFDAETPDANRWWEALSRASFALAASAVLALLGGSFVLGQRPAGTSAETHAIARALAPDDPMLASLLADRAEPPSSATLLRLMALREGGR